MTVDCGDNLYGGDDEMWLMLQDCGDTRQGRIDENRAPSTTRSLQRHISSLSDDVRTQVIGRLRDQGFLFIEQVENGPIPRNDASNVTDLGDYITTLPVDIHLRVLNRLRINGLLFPEERKK